MIHQVNYPLRVTVIVKETALARARRLGVATHATDSAKRGVGLGSMRETDKAHQNALAQVLSVLASANIRARQVRVGRAFAAAQCDLVITVGGDGTFLWASHLLGSTPILGVNSAPATSTGFFCAANAGSFARVWEAIQNGSQVPVPIARMQVQRGAELLADRVLNEVLVASHSPAAMTRIGLHVGPANARFRSSGLWVGPPAGSSAAMASAGGQTLPLTGRALQWVVREPVGGPEQLLARGVLCGKDALFVTVESCNVRMFVDGGRRPVALGIGDKLGFSRSNEPLYAWTPAF